MTLPRDIALLLMATLPSTALAQTSGAVEPFDELSGVIISLLVVVCVILAAAWLARRTPFGAATRRSGPLKLIATLPLGPKERLVLVEADGCEVLIGVSPAGICAVPRHTGARVASSTTDIEATQPPESFARALSQAVMLGDPR